MANRGALEPEHQAAPLAGWLVAADRDVVGPAVDGQTKALGDLDVLVGAG